MATPKRTTNSHPWYMIIDNLPSQYTWQNLKDMVRCAASHGVWTDTRIRPSRVTHTGGNANDSNDGSRGEVRVKRDDEARRLYAYLTSNPVEGRELRVHLFDTSHETNALFDCCNCDSIAGPPVNCPRYNNAQQTAQAVSQNALSLVWQRVTPLPQALTAAASSYPPFHLGYAHGVPQPIGQMSSISGHPMQPAVGYPSMAALFASGVPQMGTLYAVNRTTAAHTAPQYQQSGTVAVNAVHSGTHLTSYGQYPVPHAEMPVNIANGAFPTEKRGVFVSNLTYKATTKEVNSLFMRAGTVTSCDIPLNPSTGKSKGNAVVQYESAGEALVAISMFNDMKFKGLALNVRHDTNVVPIKANDTAQQQGERATDTPVIVNGSCVRRPPPDPTTVSFPTVKRVLT